jgi:hypothetical protein
MSYTQKIEKGYEEQGIEIDENGELRYRGTGSVFLAHQRKRKRTIYLAHPYDRRNSKRKQMIIRKLEERDFVVVDPFVGEDILAKKYGVNDYYENPCRDFAIEIKDRDFGAVTACDALFAWIPKDVTMIGTIREYDRALRAGKYIIVLCYKPNPFLEDADELYLDYQDFLNEISFKWD